MPVSLLHETSTKIYSTNRYKFRGLYHLTPNLRM